ncbi:hypothetical protein [Pseudomonas xanthosomatis]|uniref:hypothetical protein n=1 Tax=Pseudomonas xanthosomatis TaxID=2842356 RepID=UPI003515618A
MTQVQEVFTALEPRLTSSAATETVAIRLLKLLSQVVEAWGKDDSLSQTAAMTDAELLSRFVESSAIAGSLDARQQRSLARRAQARVRFLAEFSNFGGLYKVGQVASLTGWSRQTVNNHIKLEKLIAIKEGNDNYVPAFQFDQHGKLYGLEAVLELFKGMSTEAKCSFLLGYMTLEGGEQLRVFEILGRNAGEHELDQVKREAALYLQEK